MEHPGWPRHPQSARRLTMTGMVLILAAVVLVSCGKETTFARDPGEHRLTQEQKQWPDKYYALVEAGVSSRLMGMRSPGDSLARARSKITELLNRMQAQWSSIDSLGTAEALVAYCRAHELTPIAAAIEQTLVANKAQEPTGAQHLPLQASAIKEGLAFAHKQVTGETLR